MTVFSERYYKLICQYCVHGKKAGCAKDVPWYAVSLGCGSFEDGEPIVSVVSGRSGKVFDLGRILVDTF
jgi:hypothetical protein